MRDTFSVAFANTLKHEGGYVNDPDDPGGETIMGISRRYHPDWNGWSHIDILKSSGKPLGFSGPLTGAVKLFYRQEFWNRFSGDEVAALSDKVATELFDTAVNLGLRRASSYLQGALNLLNGNEMYYKDIVEDGFIGPATLRSLENCCGPQYLSHDDREKMLVKVMNILQGGHYVRQMRKYPVMEKYRGWFARV